MSKPCDLPTSPSAVSAKQRAANSRCAAMVHHARLLIMGVGVDRFSLNEVLRLSGGSKATLTKYFGGRTGLIAAAIQAEAKAAVEGLDLQGTMGRRLPLQQALTYGLTGILRFYLTPGALALYRAVVSAASADAGGAEAFYAHGHREIVRWLAALLEARQPAEVRSGLDCADVADQLLHAIRAGFYEQVLIGVIGEDMEETMIEKRVAATLALVLPGIAPMHSS